MSKLTKKDIVHVAVLSNLVLTPTEIEKFTPQLEKIIEFVSTLDEVNTDYVEPTSQTTGLVNVLREDIIKTENQIPQEDYFKVKKILENRSNE